MRSIVSNVEVYINNQQIYNSNGLYAHKSYISNNFKAAISEYEGVLHCEGYDIEQNPEGMKNPLPDPFFTRRMKLLDCINLCKHVYHTENYTTVYTTLYTTVYTENYTENYTTVYTTV